MRNDESHRGVQEGMETPSLQRRQPRRRVSKSPQLEKLEGRTLLASGQGVDLSKTADLAGFSLQTSRVIDWGQPVRLVGVIQNLGDVSVTQTIPIQVVLASSDEASRELAEIGVISISSPLAPGGSASFDQSLLMPSVPLSELPDGSSVYIKLKIDPENQIIESNKNNNVDKGVGIDQTKVQIAPLAHTDLKLSGFQISQDQLEWGSRLSVSARVVNQGQSVAKMSRARVVLTPVGSHLGEGEDFTIGDLEVPGLVPGQFADLVQDLTLPTEAPLVLNGFSVFTLAVVPDVEFSQPRSVIKPPAIEFGVNASAVRIAPSSTSSPAYAPKPNLSVSRLQTPGPLQWGRNFSVQVEVANLGDAASGPVDLGFRVSDLGEPPSSVLNLGQAALGQLNPGETQRINVPLKLPVRLPDGSFPAGNRLSKLFAEIDPENRINESNESNNRTESSPLSLITEWTGGDFPLAKSHTELAAARVSRPIQPSSLSQTRKEKTPTGERQPQSSLLVTTAAKTVKTRPRQKLGLIPPTAIQKSTIAFQPIAKSRPLSPKLANPTPDSKGQSAT